MKNYFGLTKKRSKVYFVSKDIIPKFSNEKISDIKDDITHWSAKTLLTKTCLKKRRFYEILGTKVMGSESSL